MTLWDFWPSFNQTPSPPAPREEVFRVGDYHATIESVAEGLRMTLIATNDEEPFEGIEMVFYSTKPGAIEKLRRTILESAE